MAEYIATGIKPRLAFIGIGWIGLSRMKSLMKEELCEPVAVLDPSVISGKLAIETAPDAILYESIDELIDKKPDGIVIATPSAMHAEQSITALRSGIPVFCQKPLARTAQESLEVIKTAWKFNKLLGVDLSYRHTDGMQKIYQLAHKKKLGKIYAVDLVFHNAYGPNKGWFYDPALSGGGCLVDLGIHLVDLALWVLDFPEVETVDSVLMEKGRVIEKEKMHVSEDYVSAQMVTENGISIRLTCSWDISAGRNADIQASFFGTQASALFYNVNGSYYDFETRFCHRTSGEIISKPPDDWGGKALIAWTKKIQRDNSFNDEALQYYKVAKILDRIYKRKIHIPTNLLT